jgi:spore coat polysaccharide biosynthesis protein SpsF (cytidylyltransferase family)
MTIHRYWVFSLQGEVHWPEGNFKVLLLHHDPDYGSYRWTVDTAADLELLRQIYTRFRGRTDFTWLEVLELFQKEPELAAINADIQHKTAYDVDHRSASPRK